MKLLQACAPPALEDRRRARAIAGLVGRSAGQLQREVRLHRRADVGRPARIDRPAAARELMVLDVSGTADADLVRLPAQKGHQQDIFRFEDRVAFELADPVALVFLPVQEPVAGALERGVEGGSLRTTPSRRTARARPSSRTGGRRLRPCWRSWVPYPLPHCASLRVSPATGWRRGVDCPQTLGFSRKRCTS